MRRRWLPVGCSSSPLTPVVEFVGLPGSGKSTMTRATAATLDESGSGLLVRSLDGAEAMPKGVTRRILAAVSAMFLRPALIWPVIRVLMTVERKQVPKCVAICGMVALRARLIAHARQHEGVVLVDHGIGQAGWSLCFRAPSDESLAAILLLVERALPAQPICFVHVDVPAVVAAQRLSGRADENRSLRLADLSLAEALERTQGYFGCLEKFGGPLFRLGGEECSADKTVACLSRAGVLSS
jgi:hypothetical protein